MPSHRYQVVGAVSVRVSARPDAPSTFVTPLMQPVVHQLTDVRQERRAARNAVRYV